MQEKQSVPLELQLEQSKKGFAVRPGVETAATVGCADRRPSRRFHIQIVHVGNHVEKTLCAQKKASSGPLVEGESKRSGERIDRLIALCAVAMQAAVSALRSKAIVRRDCFQQGRFAGSVLTGEEADSRPEIESIQRADRRNGEWVIFPALYPIAQQGQPFQHRSSVRELRVNHLQPQRLLEDIEIAVSVQQFMARFQAESGDQTIDRLANRVTARSQDLAVLGGYNG